MGHRRYSRPALSGSRAREFAQVSALLLLGVNFFSFLQAQGDRHGLA
jgi:hypothetical protein